MHWETFRLHALLDPYALVIHSLFKTLRIAWDYAINQVLGKVIKMKPSDLWWDKNNKYNSYKMYCIGKILLFFEKIYPDVCNMYTLGQVRLKVNILNVTSVYVRRL
jgi:hypothetical protein